MARLAGKEAIYAAADLFRDTCLTKPTSLLWPSELAWDAPTIQLVLDAVLGNLDEGERGFLEKLRDQLEPLTDSAHRVAADALAFYYLFPNNTNAATKSQRLREVIGWRFSSQAVNLATIERAFEAGGMANPGIYYNTGQPWQFTFFLRFAAKVHRENLDTKDAAACKAAAVQIEGSAEHRSGSGLHVLLHLLFPDHFERAVSARHRQMIVGALGSEDDPDDLDLALNVIRGRLQEEYAPEGPAIDFYQPHLKELWQPSGVEPPPPPGERRVWIEKTHVVNRPDRQSGEFAVGHMLWSPQRGKNGADIYRFMRAIQPGDVVLHLTDNEGFTGRSIASSSAAEFNGLVGTDWNDRPSYKVALHDYSQLEPPLKREVFFGAPFGEQLVSLLEDGHLNLFFNKEPSLNQGRYLTPAPAELLSILEAAYRTVGGSSLVNPSEAQPVIQPPVQESLNLIAAEFAEALTKANLRFGPSHGPLVRSFIASLACKGFVILTGLSGSGKSQIAIKFGQWLGAGRYLLVPVRPDWTGPDAIFGYEDALKAEKEGERAWHVPEVLSFMLKAAADPRHPYALVLDEMNLAHVERYFADALSGMESREPCLPNLVPGADRTWRQASTGPKKLPFPANLFIIGTVNVDETTYLFSPKVLDRANTFEFRVATSDLLITATKPGPVVAGRSDLVRGLLAIATNEGWHREHASPWSVQYAQHLATLHQLLTEAALEFGHRVYYEAMRFAALHFAAGEIEIEATLDRQILQKVLPRIHGSRKKVEASLCALGRFCHDLEFVPGSALAGSPAKFDPTAATGSAPRLPASFEKIQRMLRTLRANQFTSFTE